MEQDKIGEFIAKLRKEKNKVKKIYGENAFTDRENVFEEKLERR